MTLKIYFDCLPPLFELLGSSVPYTAVSLIEEEDTPHSLPCFLRTIMNVKWHLSDGARVSYKWVFMSVERVGDHFQRDGTESPSVLFTKTSDICLSLPLQAQLSPFLVLNFELQQYGVIYTACL